MKDFDVWAQSQIAAIFEYFGLSENNESYSIDANNKNHANEDHTG